MIELFSIKPVSEYELKLRNPVQSEVQFVRIVSTTLSA